MREDISAHGDAGGTARDSSVDDGQRVLALTFMHGSRRRLSERLRSVANLGERGMLHESMPLRGAIYRRWRGWQARSHPSCGRRRVRSRLRGSGLLLVQQQVCTWVAASFPIVLVDEGQDLKPERLRMSRRSRLPFMR